MVRGWDFFKTIQIYYIWKKDKIQISTKFNIILVSFCFVFLSFFIIVVFTIFIIISDLMHQTICHWISALIQSNIFISLIAWFEVEIKGSWWKRRVQMDYHFANFFNCIIIIFYLNNCDKTNNNVRNYVV